MIKNSWKQNELMSEMLEFMGEKWLKGWVVEITCSVSYEVTLSVERVVKGHIEQMKKCCDNEVIIEPIKIELSEVKVSFPIESSSNEVETEASTISDQDISSQETWKTPD